MDRTPMEELERSLGRLFALARRHGREASEQLGAELQPAAWAVLRHIVWNTPVTASALVDALETDKSSVSRQVKALRDLGLVQTTPSPDDARVALIEPTSTGRERTLAVIASGREAYRRAAERLGDDELATLAALLSRFVEELD